MASQDRARTKLAIIISHPIQYFVPLYQRLAIREELDVKVFFTWHCGSQPVMDHGFKRHVAWDIPLSNGYVHELIPNLAADPGTHHFWGLRNPALVERVLAWRPDAVHITGWAWFSNLKAIRAFAGIGVPVLFRGDSHLLDPNQSGARWWLKRATLRYIYSKPTAFLVVGTANRAYYEAFGVPSDRLVPCPHSIDVARFAEPAAEYEREALRWRRELRIGDNCLVVLFAGKFERKKQPLELMRAVQAIDDTKLVLVMVGNGELEQDVQALAATDHRFRVLPFQNQSRMPILYRLGQLFVLPSAYGETWGLAVNEAMACGVPVLVSSCVGCAKDAITDSCGRIFPAGNYRELTRAIAELTRDANRLKDMGIAAARRAWAFDISRTETAMADAIQKVCLRRPSRSSQRDPLQAGVTEDEA